MSTIASFDTPTSRIGCNNCQFRSGPATLVESTGPGTRDDALDFVKGTLVLIMVLYHWLNYFVGLEWSGYRYLRFLTPSFLLITGFVVSHVYLRRYSTDSDQLRRRLVQRGTKLLGVFVALNLLADAVVPSARVFEPSLFNIIAVFALGTGRAAFDILVPIGYFLVSAPIVVLILRRTGVSVGAAGCGAVLATAVAEAAGLSHPHVELLSFAFLGLAVGSTEPARLESVIRRPGMVVVIYAIYTAALAMWNARYPLQVVGVLMSVILVYLAGRRWSSGTRAGRYLVELGRYSLVAYIMQIVALQLLHRASAAIGSDVGSAFSLAVCAGVTLLSVWVADALRRRWQVADRLYKTVFA